MIIKDVSKRGLPKPTLFEQLMRQMKSDRQSKITKHKAAFKKRKLDLKKPPPVNIFADGDSWFDYPLYKDTINWIQKNAASGTLVLNMAHYGDASTQTLGVAKRERMKTVFADPECGKFDAILLSAGGNDICGDQFVMWVNEKTANVDINTAVIQDRLDEMLNVIGAAYADMIELRDTILPNAIMFVYNYDFVIPSDKGICGIGPWVKPSLDYLGWTDPAEAAAIAKVALIKFDLLMQHVANTHKNVVYVNTQGTLTAADWSNELHPTESGFQKIAAKFMTALQTSFPGRI